MEQRSGRMPIDLGFLSLPGTLPGDEPPNHESILAWLCRPLPADVESLLGRGAELPSAPAVPGEEQILLKLAFPLRGAKGCYMLGNYLGTIALTGMVCEMLAILAWEVIAQAKVGAERVTPKKENQMFGATFEKLGQQRRVDVLLGWGVIDEETKEKFDLVRNTRRRYLHLWSQEHNSIASDAKACFEAALLLFLKVLGLKVSKGGRFELRNQILEYLHRSGALQLDDE